MSPTARGRAKKRAREARFYSPTRSSEAQPRRRQIVAWVSFEEYFVHFLLGGYIAEAASR